MMLLHLIKLARPHQWSKSVFVLVGPLYGLRGGTRAAQDVLIEAAIACVVFALVSSGCYIINDLMDAEADRRHPRKKNRPLASGVVSTGAAKLCAAALLAVGGALVFALPRETWMWVGVFVGLYVTNVVAYSVSLKHQVILDVMSLSMGFILRVLGGCAATLTEPSPWLLTCTFFIAMFLAFGKRLGERRTMGTPEEAAAARAVQEIYTDEMLRMVVVVTGVATLLTYAGYVQDHAGLTTNLAHRIGGVNPLWLTLLPATYALMRCIVLLEQGTYDDPTELASRDRPAQLAGLVFAVLTGWAMWAAAMPAPP